MRNEPQRTDLRPLLATIAAAATLTAATAGAQSAPPEPLIRTGAAQQVSEHVYVILDQNVSFVPNVGIVVGDRATLIVDTGLGEANGRIVLQEARHLSDNEIFYITATHFHPEHDLGATAFPESARMVRWTSQQAEADTQGATVIERFSGISPALAGLLDGARFRAPDVLFDDHVTIDLGGVRVTATGVGPNHTLGDTVFWVEGDRVLFAGDVVMPVFPGVSGQSGDVDKWLDNLETFNRLDPAVVVPAHGRLGGIELVHRYRDYLEAVRERVQARRRVARADRTGPRRNARPRIRGPRTGERQSGGANQRGDPGGLSRGRLIHSPRRGAAVAAAPASARAA